MKQKRNSFPTDAAEIKMKGNLRLDEKFAESVNSCCLNVAKLLMFKFSYIKQFFFLPRVFVEELAYSWFTCFEKLSLSLLCGSHCLSEQELQRQQTLHHLRPADTVRHWNWQPAESGPAKERNRGQLMSLTICPYLYNHKTHIWWHVLLRPSITPL